jgi:hypothetical protein
MSPLLSALLLATSSSPLQPVDLSTAAEPMDIEAELSAARAICSSSGDFACAMHIAERTKAIEVIVFSPRNAAQRTFVDQLNATYHARHAVHALQTSACTPGGPSPICRMGIMNGCDCSGSFPGCTRDTCCATTTYTCSWYNFFCWAMCAHAC